MKVWLLALALLVTDVVPWFPVSTAEAQESSYRAKKRRYTPPAKKKRKKRKPVTQESKLGVYMGVGITGHFVPKDNDSDLTSFIESGGGINMAFGARFLPVMALEVGIVASLHSTDPTVNTGYRDGTLYGVSVDGLFYLLPSAGAIEPYVQAGLGAYSFMESRVTARELTGGGFHVGGGVDLHVSRDYTFGVRALYKGIAMDNSTEWYPATENVYLNLWAIEGGIKIFF